MSEFGAESLRKLRTCDPRLQALFARVNAVWPCTIIEGHRGEEAQNKAFREGKSKLKWPHGNHNAYPSRAVDVLPDPVDFTARERILAFGGFVAGVAFSMGLKLRWGSQWDGIGKMNHKGQLEDADHFEILE